MRSCVEMVNDGGGWLHMQTAPRDGTPVELKCVYGVAPWYGLYRWTNKNVSVDGVEFISDFIWRNCNGDPTFPSSEAELMWRPYGGAPEAYVDPTGGAYKTAEYWRVAVARQHGLPDNYFEKPTKRHSGFWSWLRGADTGRRGA